MWQMTGSVQGLRDLTPLSRRRPEPYRVYAEDEFLQDAGPTAAHLPLASPHGDQRARRFAGLALLTGALGAVGGVIVANCLTPARDSARKARGRSHAAARSQLAGRATAATEARQPSPRAARPARRRRSARHVPSVRRLHVRGAAEHADFGRAGSYRSVARPATIARSTAMSSSRRPPARHAEFGFER